MAQAQGQVSPLTYAAAIESCQRDWRQATVLLDELSALGENVPLSLLDQAYGAALGCCGRAEKPSEGYALYMRMREVGLKPSSKTFRSAMLLTQGPLFELPGSTLAPIGLEGANAALANVLLADMRACGLTPRYVHFHAAIQVQL
jgi:pentatricopeptide repeat protein